VHIQEAQVRRCDRLPALWQAFRANVNGLSVT